MMSSLVASLSLWVSLQGALDAGPPAMGATDDAVADADAVGDAGVVADPPITLRATLDPPTPTFGEPFALVVTLERDRGLRLELPGSLPAADGAPLAGDPGRTVQDGATPGRVVETIRIPLLALDTAPTKTPAFTLSATGNVHVDVPALDVRVVVPPEPVVADAGPAGALQLEPAAPAIAYAVPDARPWVVLSAFATSSALYALVRWAARRRRMLAPPAPAVPLAPPRPAHEVALERLDALLASGLLARGEVATFVERLMDEVLRDYLTARFALSAGTRTTRELVADLLSIAVAGLDVQLVEGLLADADLVKFARAAIAPERAHAMATRVRALVESTAAPVASSEEAT